MSSSRANTVTFGMAAASLVEVVQLLFGVKLTLDQGLALVTLAFAVFHALASMIERYWPPPNPTPPARPALPERAP